MPYFKLKFETAISSGGYQMDSDTGLVTEKHPGSLETRRWMDSQEIFLAAQEFQQILETDAEAKYDFLTIKAVERFCNSYGPLDGPWIDADETECQFFGIANMVTELIEKPLFKGLKQPIVEVPDKNGKLTPAIVPEFLWEAIVLAYKFPDAEFRTCQYRINHGGPRRRTSGICPPNCLISKKQKWGEGCQEHNRKIGKGLTTHKED